MKGEFAAGVAALGDNDEIRAILEEVCRITHMGFAAVARVTDGRFFGTLCAIDPEPRALSAPATVSRMKRLALAVADIRRRPAPDRPDALFRIG